MALIAQQPESLDRVAVPLADLTATPMVRSEVSRRHVELLLDTLDNLPPILVSARDHRIIDGIHRYHAARKAGKTTILSTYFYGSPEDELREAIRLNTTHGLPLTLEERRRAALRVISLQGDWSDRSVAELCGLSASTVARLRGSELAQISNMRKRRGRDGRLRPVNRDQLRHSIKAELLARPGASLRDIARTIGASPSTVASVRRRLVASDARSIEDMEPDRKGGESPGDFQSRLETRAGPSAQNWQADSALQSTLVGDELASWLSRTAVDIEDLRYCNGIPLSRVYEISDEARLRADFWQKFARLAENRCSQVSHLAHVGP